ncbi:DMT family protein [Nitrospira sp. Nam74]
MTFLTTVSLLILSNVFMTVAWYGHLRFMTLPLWLAVIASWSIAFLEYCFQVPANRIGYPTLSAYQLKTIQEVITLTVFVVFAEVYLGEGLKPKHMAGFILLAIAAWTVFQDQYGVEW